MKKNMFKKTVAILMATMMLFSTVGCGKKENKGGKSEKKDTKTMTYEGEEFKVEGIKGDIGQFYVKGDKIYLDTYEWVEGNSDADKPDKEEGVGELPEEEIGGDSSEEETSEEVTTEEVTTEEATTEAESSEEETSEADSSEVEVSEGEGEASSEVSEEEYMDGTSISRYYSMNLDGTDVKELKMPTFDENEYMSTSDIDAAGNRILVTTVYDMKSEKSKAFLYKVDAEGKELAKEDITKAIGADAEEKYVEKMMLDDKGRIIMSVGGMGNSEIFIFDENFKSLGKIVAEKDIYIAGLAKTKDGKIVCAYSGGDGSYVQELDADKKAWGEKYKLDIAWFNGNDSVLNGIEYDFYYKDDKGIYGYDIAAKKGTQVLDYVASNLTSESSWNIVPVSADRMLGTTYDDKGSKFINYKKVDPSTITDKKTITYGAMYIDDNMKKAAIEFNKKSKDFKIDFIDYQDSEDPEAKMNAEIAAGNIPDIIDLSGGPADMYAAKGMLEDLMPYLEKDSELSKDDFLPTVLEALQSEDGKLYYAAPSFGISTLMGKTSDVGKNIGWTFEDMKALLDKKGSKSRLFYSTYKEELLNNFYYSYSDFVNWETGECSFDSQDFKDILELCNTGLPGEPKYDDMYDEDAYLNSYKSGEVLLQEGWITMEEMAVYRAVFGEEVTFVGYPNKDKSGSYFQFDHRVGISSKSDAKDAAWEFVRTLLTMEYQSTQGNIWNIPTRKDSYEMLVKTKTTTKEYTDELGQQISPLEGGMSWGSVEVEYKPLSQADVDKFNELIENTHKSSSYDIKIMEIIQEETKPYFAGNKSIDETADIIQNRVKTYVNENR